MSRTKLRNHYAVEAHFRKAGPHGKTAKALRRKHHMEEQHVIAHKDEPEGIYTDVRMALRDLTKGD